MNCAKSLGESWTIYNSPEQASLDNTWNNLKALKNWSAREEIIATKLKIEKGQDKLIVSNKSLSANLHDYDKCLKDQAQKLVLKDELDREEHYEKEYLQKKIVQNLDPKVYVKRPRPKKLMCRKQVDIGSLDL